jgi:hypothetical protein
MTIFKIFCSAIFVEQKDHASDSAFRYDINMAAENCNTINLHNIYAFFPWLDIPNVPRPPHRVFHITLRYTTLGRTLPDEWPAPRRSLPHNTRHTEETNIHVSAEFEPEIPANEQPQTNGLDRAGTGNGVSIPKISWKYIICKNLRTHRHTQHTPTVHVHHKNLLAFHKRKETKKRKIKGDVEREKCRQWGWRMAHRSYESLPDYTASHPTRP